MKFKPRNLRALADCVIGDAKYFPYRSSSKITRFLAECDLDFEHMDRPAGHGHLTD